MFYFTKFVIKEPVTILLLSCTFTLPTVALSRYNPQVKGHRINGTQHRHFMDRDHICYDLGKKQCFSSNKFLGCSLCLHRTDNKKLKKIKKKKRVCNAPEISFICF